MVNQTLHLFSRIVTVIIFLIAVTETGYSQLQRERAIPDRQLDRVFWTTQNVGLTTTEMVSKKNLNSSVIHTFGLINGGIDRFYGLDDGANTRISIEYGLTDRVNLAIRRMTFRKVVDVRSKIKIMHQTESGNKPVSIVLQVSAAATTVAGQNLAFAERLSYLSALMISRKMGSLSLQLSPMAAHFNNPPGANPNRLIGAGFVAQYELNDRFSLSAEYLPVFGDRFAGTVNTFGTALNIDTGGHVFQLFLTTSQFHNEQFIMANNRDRFEKGEFRFGFNIHRNFGL
jgi:hypothetical protein